MGPTVPTVPVVTLPTTPTIQTPAGITPTGNTPVGHHGSLYVQDGFIKNQHGQAIQLRGASLFWSQWSRFNTGGVVQWLAVDWEATVIRCAMGAVAHRKGYMSLDPVVKQDHLNKVNTVVDAAIAMGIYVIIDWHIDGPNGFQLQSAAQEFFAMVAQKYAQYPNVLFEPWNEPMDTDSWSWHIKPYHQNIVQAIRAYSNNIILLGSRSWSQDVDEAANDPVTCPTCYNLAYTLHIYAINHGHKYRAKALHAVNKGIAIFATEWGVCAWYGGTDSEVNWGEVKMWTDLFDTHMISSTHWSLNDNTVGPDAEACSMVHPSASSDGQWNENDLSTTGRAMKAYIKGQPYLVNGGPVTR